MTFQPGEAIDPATLVGQRWFAAPDRPVRSARVIERFDLPGGGALAILQVEVDARRPVYRTLPITDGADLWTGLFRIATSGAMISGATGTRLFGHPPAIPPVMSGASVRPLGRDQSHTSVIVDDVVVLKLYRALTPGVNAEVELGEALEADPDAPVPAFRGAVVWGLDGREYAIALVQDFVPDAGDAFEELADRLSAWLSAGAPNRAIPSLIEVAAPAARAAARLHGSLSRVRGRAFAARPAGSRDVARWRRRAARAHRTAERRLRTADPARAGWLVARRAAVERALEPLSDASSIVLQRIHADLHLGQLLRRGAEFLLADLEGEPLRPVGERRRLDAPLRDVASMLRSFDHVARSGMRRSGVPIDEVAAGTSAADPAIEAWLGTVRHEFLAAYEAEAAAAGVSVRLDPHLLQALEVEKELYEFAYAATYLPTWMYAPSAGMRWLLDHARRPT